MYTKIQMQIVGFIEKHKTIKKMLDKEKIM